MNLHPQVVLVDDEPLMVRSFSLMLQDYFQVIGFTDPLKAMEYLEATADPAEILLVISDARMPEIAGTDLLQRTAYVLPRSQRIMVTGAREFEVAQEAVNKGKVDCFLTKPLHPVLLINISIGCAEQVILERIKDRQGFMSRLEETEKQQLQYVQQFFEKVNCIDYEKHPAEFSAYQQYYRCLQSYRQNRMEELCLEGQYHAPASVDPVIGSIQIRLDLLRAAILLEKASAADVNFHEQKEWMAEAGILVQEASQRMTAEQLNVFIPLIVDAFPQLTAWAVAKELFSVKQSVLIDSCREEIRQTPWTINTLGPLTITYEGSDIDVMNRLKQKEVKVLTFLLCRAGKRTPVEILLETFWPEKSEKQGLNCLYQIIHTLRKTLEPDLDHPKNSRLIRYQDRYCWLDASLAQIEDLALLKEIDRAMAQWEAGRTESFIATCHALTQIYHAPYLIEWQYEDWITERRTDIRMKWQKTLFHYVNVLVNQDKFQEAQQMLENATRMGLVEEEVNHDFLWRAKRKAGN
jgi:two-component SAPR family response regulator